MQKLYGFLNRLEDEGRLGKFYALAAAVFTLTLLGSFLISPWFPFIIAGVLFVLSFALASYNLLTVAQNRIMRRLHKNLSDEEYAELEAEAMRYAYSKDRE